MTLTDWGFAVLLLLALVLGLFETWHDRRKR